MQPVTANHTTPVWLVRRCSLLPCPVASQQYNSASAIVKKDAFRKAPLSCVAESTKNAVNTIPHFKHFALRLLFAVWLSSCAKDTENRHSDYLYKGVVKTTMGSQMQRNPIWSNRRAFDIRNEYKIRSPVAADCRPDIRAVYIYNPRPCILIVHSVSGA